MDRPYWQPDVETIPRADLIALQAARLADQVARAARAPFYQRLWGRAEGPVIHSTADIRRLPFLHKQDLIQAQLREPPLGDLPLAPREQWREVYPVHATGGSLYTTYADADLTRSADVGARVLWALGLRPGELVHNGFSYGLFAGGIFIHRAVRALGATVIPIGTDSVKRQVEFLFNFQPAMLVGAPSHVLYLAERILERGLSPRDAGVRVGLFGAEPGAAEAGSRARLEQLFGCQAYDLYGITEIGTLLAGECPAQRGLHWAEDHVLLEVIDPRTLEPCAEGETGVLVLTDLTRHNMPLLRYWTGDMAAVTYEPCACGRTHARSIGGIRGRTDGLVMYRGTKFYPGQVERILSGYGNLGSEYRIILERDGATLIDRCTVQVEAAPGGAVIAPGLTERIEQGLQDEIGPGIAVQVLPFGALVRSPRKEHRVEDRRAGL